MNLPLPSGRTTLAAAAFPIAPRTIDRFVGRSAGRDRNTPLGPRQLLR